MHSSNKIASKDTRHELKLYCAEAVTYCYQHFRLCPPIILAWNRTTQTFSRSSNYLPWLICLVGGIAGITGSTSILSIWYASHLILLRTLLATVLGPCVSMCSVFGLVMYFYCDDIILAFGEMRRLLFQLEQLFPPISVKDKAQLQKLDAEWKVTGVLLKINVKALIAMKWIFPTFLVYYDLDPHYFPYLFFELGTSIVDKLFRFITMFISLLVGTQVYGTTMMTIFLWLEMQSKVIQGLSRISNHPVKSDEFYLWYLKFYIVSHGWGTAASEWIRVLMSSVFGLIVVCNVVTIRFFGVVPLEVFWFMPTAAIMNTSTLYLIFPYLIGCHEETKELISQKRKRLASVSISTSFFGRKLGLRKLKSLRTVAMHCGGMFPLKKQTKAEFFFAIVQRTLDGILL